MCLSIIKCEDFLFALHPTYERDFFLSLFLSHMTDFTQPDTLQIHPGSSKLYGFILPYGWVVFHCMRRGFLMQSSVPGRLAWFLFELL